MKKLTAPLLVFCALFLTAGAVASCGAAADCKDPANATSPKCTVINTTKECGGDTFDALVSEQLAKFTDDLSKAIHGDGSIDYQAAVPVIEDYAFKFGGCVVTELFGRLSHLHFAEAPGSASSTPHATPAALAATYQKYRATHYTGVEFKTPSAPSGTP